MRPLSLVLFLVIVSSQAAVSGQTTRAEIIEKQRADKAATLAPYKPGKIEKLLLNAEDGKLKRLVAPHNGFFVGYGYTYRPTGAGFALGGGFRHDLFDRRARVVFEAGQSFRNYNMVRGDFSLPRLARREAGSGRRRHLPPSAAGRLLRPRTGFEQRGSRQLSLQGQRIQRPGDRHPSAVVQLRHARRARRSRHPLGDRRHDSIDRTAVRRCAGAGTERAADLPVR